MVMDQPDRGPPGRGAAATPRGARNRLVLHADHAAEVEEKALHFHGGHQSTAPLS